MMKNVELMSIFELKKEYAKRKLSGVISYMFLHDNTDMLRCETIKDELEFRNRMKNLIRSHL